MSFRPCFGVQFIVSGALVAISFGGCSGGAPARPKADGGAGDATGTGGNSGGDEDGGSGGAMGSGGNTGSGGLGDTGGAAGGTLGSGGAGALGGTAGNGGRGGTGGASATGGATAAGGAGGIVASCAKTLFGRYLLRNDGAILYEPDSATTGEMTVVDAGTGLSLRDVKEATEGAAHGCAVLGTAKTAWCWRQVASGNASGQLGNGTMDTTGALFRASQVLTAANQPLTNVISVARLDVANSPASCAITQDGKLYCWGDLTYLVNSASNRPVDLKSAYAVPITTDGTTPITGVVQVSLAGTFACAIAQGTNSKDVLCWGQNVDSNLGTGDTTVRQYPTKVVGIANPNRVMAQSGRFVGWGTVCVLDGANVRCWGSNTYGEAGTGAATTANVLAPSTVNLMGGAAPLAGIIDIVAGEIPSGGGGAFCTLATNSTALCWGRGFQAYPTTYGITNVTALGAVTDQVQPVVRILTSDGLYHIGNTTRAPNCGLLQ